MLYKLIKRDNIKHFINLKNVTKITQTYTRLEIEYVNHSGFGSWIFGCVGPKVGSYTYETENDCSKEFEKIYEEYNKFYNKKE
jgi:hypothetical protein